MSTVTTSESTSNQLNNDYDFTKIFVGENRYDEVSHENTTGVEEILLAGTLMGRITAGGNVIPLASGAGDGSEIPLGVLAQNHTVAIGATLNVSICVSGDVDEGSIIFDGADDFDTVVDGRSLRDRIAGDTLGINLSLADELSGFDN